MRSGQHLLQEQTDAPAGASMISCRVSAGTCISTLRNRPPFWGAALAP